jgi:TetR/AcrR family transcriptional regulator
MPRAGSRIASGNGRVANTIRIRIRLLVKVAPHGRPPAAAGGPVPAHGTGKRLRIAPFAGPTAPPHRPMSAARKAPVRRPQAATSATAKSTGGATRDEILGAALKVFARDTFEGASLLDIAQQAGVGQPLIHYHFGSKDNLWRATVDYALADLAKFYQGVVATTVDLEPIDTLKVMCRAFVQFAARYPEHAQIFVNESRVAGERLDWLVDNYLRPIHRHMDSVVALAIERGQVKPIPVMHITNTIFTTLVHFFAYRPLLTALYDDLDPTAPEAIDAHAKHTLEIIFNGIKA